MLPLCFAAGAAVAAVMAAEVLTRGGQRDGSSRRQSEGGALTVVAFASRSCATKD